MAMTHTRAAEVAELLQALCTEAKRLHNRVVDALEQNSDLSIDWAGDPKPAYLNEDSDGNLDGFSFTRANVANAIGSLDQFRRLLTNQSLSQGDHLGNVNQLADVGQDE